jgi:hypothetical protein
MTIHALVIDLGFLYNLASIYMNEDVQAIIWNYYCCWTH